MKNKITFEEFEKVDIRVGEIIEVKDFVKAKFPTYQLKIDFGDEIGIKQSSARFKSNYTKEELLNKQCLAVINFEPRNIAGFQSEVLVYFKKRCKTNKLFTSTNESNIPMQKSLEKAGYSKSGIIYNLDDNDPEIIYLKQVTTDKSLF